MEKAIKIENQSERLSLSSDEDTQDSRIRNLAPDPCQICGSIGFEGLIITCFKCREMREHTYCARTPLPCVPDIWLCEVCRSSNGLIETTAVEEDCALMALAINAIEKGSCSEPDNCSSTSWTRSNKTSKLRTYPVEDSAEPNKNTYPDLQTSVYNISGNGGLALHKPPEGLNLRSHINSEGKESGVICEDTCIGQEQEESLFEAFPRPRKKRRTLRLTVGSSADIGVKTIA